MKYGFHIKCMQEIERSFKAEGNDKQKHADVSQCIVDGKCIKCMKCMKCIKVLVESRRTTCPPPT